MYTKYDNLYRKYWGGSPPLENILGGGVAPPLPPCSCATTKKGNLRKCKNYRTLSLISNSSTILLRIIFNRMNPRFECILSE